MNLILSLVGAGEYTSLEDSDHTTKVFLRFRDTEGRTLDLPVSAEQLKVVLSFSVAGSRKVAIPKEDKAPDPQARIDSSSPAEDRGDPSIVDEDDIDGDTSVYLRSRPGTDVPLFLGRDEEL